MEVEVLEWWRRGGVDNDGDDDSNNNINHTDNGNKKIRICIYFHILHTNTSTSTLTRTNTHTRNKTNKHTLTYQNELCQLSTSLRQRKFNNHISSYAIIMAIQFTITSSATIDLITFYCSNDINYGTNLSRLFASCSALQTLPSVCKL